jgi:hypothetical protein
MRRIYHFIPSKVSPFELVSFLKELSLHSLFDFPLRLCGFPCNDPSLLLLLDHLLVEVASSYAQPQKLEGIVDQ